MPPSVMWFRRDLRLVDNPALAAAAASAAGDSVVGLFVLDPAFATAGAARQHFLHESLRDLNDAMGGALVVRSGDPATVVPDVAAAVGAPLVTAAADAGPYGRQRDDAVATGLTKDDRHLDLVGSPYAVPPGTVLKADKQPFSVYTPFSRAWRAVGWEAPIDAPNVDWCTGRKVTSEKIPPAPHVDAELPPVGEAAAAERLDDFLDSDAGRRYDRQRNRPDLDGTSRLSPYLRWGAIHPRQILARLDNTKSHGVFRNELAWREFYADVLFHRPDSAWHNLQTRMDAMPVDTDAAARRRFTTWAEGQTGYPFVDAGLRQLLGSGWMHNRVRMATASFLVKDLHLPWQWGAQHFMQHLVDGDLASNNHGWQWTAGTGTDAAPYFRIFNPVLQSKRFDPDGTYIRRWVPELAHVDAADVHEPWASKKGSPLGYPGPMVDHATERAEALRRYALVPRTGVTR